MDANAKEEPQPPLWPFLVICAVLAAWVDLGSYHQDHTSDSLIPVLVSLYKWTPYFWDCNRIGMLVPLLALPFQHPLVNLLVQSGAVLFCTFAVFFLLPRYLLRNATWPAVGATATGLFLLAVPAPSRFVFTFGQPHYAVALALGLFGLLLLEDFPTRTGAWFRLAEAFVLMLLANWVNSATIVFIGPLVVMRGLLLGRRCPGLLRAPWQFLRMQTVWALGVLAAGCAGNFCLQSNLSVPEDPVTAGLLKHTEWPGAWRNLACNLWTVSLDESRILHNDNRSFTGPWMHSARGPVLACLTIAAALLLLPPAIRRWSGVPIRAMVVLAMASVAYGTTISTLQWVRYNHFHFRYAIPTVFFLLTALAAALVAPGLSALARRPRAVLSAVAMASLFLAATCTYGSPSLAGVRAALRDWRGLACYPPGFVAARTADVLAAHCTHVAGRYQSVWPVVFMANLTLHERGEECLVWGVTGRCLPTWEQWGRMPPEDLRLAVLLEGQGLDPEGVFYLNGFFPPMTEVSRRPTVCVFRSADEVALARGPASGGGVLASWHSGFYPQEGSAENNNRWCRGSGKLTLTNVSPGPRRIELDMTMLPGATGEAQLDLEGPLFDDHLVIGNSDSRYRRTLIIPPGKQLVRFRCDGRPSCAPGDWRRLVFRVENFRLTELAGAAETSGPVRVTPAPMTPGRRSRTEFNDELLH
jgi:hypothetical protein